MTLDSLSAVCLEDEANHSRTIAVACVSNMVGYVTGRYEMWAGGPPRTGLTQATHHWCGVVVSRERSLMVVPRSHCVPAGALDDGWRVLSMGGFLFFFLPACFNSVWLQVPNIAQAFTSVFKKWWLTVSPIVMKSLVVELAWCTALWRLSPSEKCKALMSWVL